MRPTTARGRATAILEVLGVYLAGGLRTMLLARVLAIQLVNPLNTFSADVTDAELIVATWQLFVLLLLQYVGYFLLIVPLNWWHRRRGLAAYGLTLAGHTWTTLLLAGLATAALVQWPVLGVSLADAIYDLGKTAPWREALFATSWRRWEFWFFSAVASWAVVSVVEELFFRGYCQRRLAEDWGDGPAIVVAACLFLFAHDQYLMPNAAARGVRRPRTAARRDRHLRRAVVLDCAPLARDGHSPGARGGGAPGLSSRSSATE